MSKQVKLGWEAVKANNENDRRYVMSYRCESVRLRVMLDIFDGAYIARKRNCIINP